MSEKENKAEKAEEKKFQIKTAFEILNEVEELKEEEFGRIPTFIGEFEHEGEFYDFDKDVLAGGLFRGVSIFSGFSGHGKTTFSTQTSVRQAENGFRVCYISLEQDELEIVEKALGVLSGEAFKIWEDMKFTKGNDFKDKKEEGLKLLKAYLGDDFKIVHDDFKPVELLKFVEEQKQFFDIFYIDNFQNCDLTPGKEVEELRHLSNQMMKLISKDKKTALVWLSQLSADKTKNPLKAHINYSNKLEQDATLRLVIYKNKVEKKDGTEEKEEDTIIDAPKTYLGVMKNRKGSGATLKEIKDATFSYNVSIDRIGSFTLEDIHKRLERRKKKEASKLTKATDTTNEEQLKKMAEQSKKELLAIEKERKKAEENQKQIQKIDIDTMIKEGLKNGD